MILLCSSQFKNVLNICIEHFPFLTLIIILERGENRFSVQTPILSSMSFLRQSDFLLFIVFLFTVFLLFSSCCVTLYVVEKVLDSRNREQSETKRSMRREAFR